jgi:hypothetical protein
MLSLESQPQESTNVKKVAACLTAAAALAVAGVVVSTSSVSKKDAKLALISIPEEFSGTFTHIHDDGTYNLNGKIHKFEHEDGDWQIDGLFTATGNSIDLGTTYLEYTLKDNYFIFEKKNVTTDERIEIECMERAGMIQYGQGKDILKSAILIADSPVAESLGPKVASECPAGAELAHATENGQDWVLCGDYSSGVFALTMLGEYSVARAVAVEGMVVDIQFPEDFDLEENNCTAHDPLVAFHDLATKGPAYEHRALAPKFRAGAWPYAEDTADSRELYVQDGQSSSGGGGGGISSTGEDWWGTRGSNVSPAWFTPSAAQVTFVDPYMYGCHSHGLTWEKKCIMIHGYANAGMNLWDPSEAIVYPEVRSVVSNIGNYNANGGQQNGSNGEGSDGTFPQPIEWDSGNNLGSVWGMTNVHFPAWNGCVKWHMGDCDTQARGNHNYNYHNEIQEQIITTGYYGEYCSARLYMFSHSFGGVGLQGALMTGRLNRGRIKWHQIQSSWYGSWGANFSLTACNIARNISPTDFSSFACTIAVIAIITIMNPFVGMAVFFVMMLGGNWFATKVYNDELCVKGWMLGKAPPNNLKLYPMPSNWSLNFLRWWGDGSSFDISQSINAYARAPNSRLCGIYPKGYGNGHFNRGVFLKIIAGLHLEHIDVTNIGSGNQARQHAMYKAIHYKWGAAGSNLGSSYNPTYNGDPNNDWGFKRNPYKIGEKWSDGCVDGTNCMAAHRFANAIGMNAYVAGVRLEQQMHLTATSHDEGSCRAGWAGISSHNPCYYMQQFIRFGGEAQFPDKVDRPEINAGGDKAPKGASKGGDGFRWKPAIDAAKHEHYPDTGYKPEVGDLAAYSSKHEHFPDTGYKPEVGDLEGRKDGKHEKAAQARHEQEFVANLDKNVAQIQGAVLEQKGGEKKAW